MHTVRVDLAQLVKDGKSDAAIRELLQQQCSDEHALRELLQQVKKLRAARNTSTGLIFILIGAALLLLSCAIGIFRFYSDSSLSFALYGLTSLGILVVFVGLIRIFG